jgi:hypothetical protein
MSSRTCSCCRHRLRRGRFGAALRESPSPCTLMSQLPLHNAGQSPTRCGSSNNNPPPCALTVAPAQPADQVVLQILQLHPLQPVSCKSGEGQCRMCLKSHTLHLRAELHLRAGVECWRGGALAVQLRPDLELWARVCARGRLGAGPLAKVAVEWHVWWQLVWRRPSWRHFARFFCT